MSASVQLLESTGSALREALKRHDWTVIGELDHQCRQAVEAAMVEASRDESQLRENLQTLLDLYRELVQVCQEEQQKLAAELIQTHNARQGAQVYQLFS
ncbi:flagellar protein FliT [Pseudomonas mangrovi]|uniref:Flagellar protein FliT n=1 Tax=Pseudomonas mangrovi TaxID=2161748 RepID=A0A2T5P6D0_9PSED|nr:flagellar protein FliT [Pseudomonas mangrovi]PTU73273.1 flagellar protein FliT [Pseudomonas mangrovi]